MSDFDDFDFGDFGDESADDILDSFDDGDASAQEDLSGDEVNRRVESYQKQTKQNMRKAVKPKQFKKNERLEAIRWLGESGNPEAISALVKVYKKDKTPGMKEAAAYALGQFKAHKRDEDDPEMAAIADQRVNDIILYEKFGKTASATGLIILEILLVILAIVLFSVGGVFSVQNANIRATAIIQMTTDAPTWTPDTEDALQNDLETYFADLTADANFYQQQLAAASRGESTNCNLGLLANAPNYNLSTAWADDDRYIPVATELNDIRSQMSDVRTAYADSCNSGIVLSREQALDLGGIIITVQRALSSTRETLNSSGIEVTEQVFATSTPVPTDTPDPAIPTATEDLTAVNDIIIDMERIINDMTFRGPTTAIVFNWQQVVDNGQLYISGCNQPEPIIPPDYVLPADLAGTSPQLDSALNNLNIGLQSTRLAVTAFYESCASGEVPADAGGRLAQAQLAGTAFASATNDLNAIQGR